MLENIKLDQINTNLKCFILALLSNIFADYILKFNSISSIFCLLYSYQQNIEQQNNIFAFISRFTIHIVLLNLSILFIIA